MKALNIVAQTAAPLLMASYLVSCETMNTNTSSEFPSDSTVYSANCRDPGDEGVRMAECCSSWTEVHHSRQARRRRRGR